jgi:hypothetical protein
MIDLLAIFKRRKRADATAKIAPPEEKQRQPEPRKPARFMGGACEKTHDLLVGHDGERVGFRKPVEG